jgi:hypothetical protein
MSVTVCVRAGAQAVTIGWMHGQQQGLHLWVIGDLVWEGNAYRMPKVSCQVLLSKCNQFHINDCLVCMGVTNALRPQVARLFAPYTKTRHLYNGLV